MRKPATGEPYAGKPPVRFGGRGGQKPSLPLSAVFAARAQPFTRRGPTFLAENSFKHHVKLSAETGSQTSRSSGQRRRSRKHRPASLLPLIAGVCPSLTSIHRETIHV